MGSNKNKHIPTGGKCDVMFQHDMKVIYCYIFYAVVLQIPVCRGYGISEHLVNKPINVNHTILPLLVIDMILRFSKITGILLLRLI